MKPKRIDFVFAGPSKTGSTWIYEALKAHTSICMPNAKDIYYFDRFFEKGESWYFEHFKFLPGHEISGEIAHDYIHDDKTIIRLIEHNPFIKIMICLRNPVDRAFSSYYHFIRNGKNLGDFLSAFYEHKILREEGLGSKYIKRLKRYLPDNQVKILFFDDLENNPCEFYNEIVDFLGVENQYDKKRFSIKYNASGKSRSKLVIKIVKTISSFLKNNGFSNFVGSMKTNDFIQRILYDRSQNDSYKLDNKTISEIYKFYVSDIDEIEALTGRDLIAWRF